MSSAGDCALCEFDGETHADGGIKEDRRSPDSVHSEPGDQFAGALDMAQVRADSAARSN